MPRARPPYETRRCAHQTCGIEFEPRHPNAAYHSRECKDNARYADRRRAELGHALCRSCKKPVEGMARFCGEHCKWTYLRSRSRVPSCEVRHTASLQPVSVLLPLGCQPRRNPGERDFTCRQYERCLSYAASKGWSGFNCETCPMGRKK